MTKITTLPSRFEAGFLSEIDRRTDLYKTLRRNYREICDDLGGEDTLSHAKRTLVERFVFLQACLQTWENRIATSPKDTEKLLSRWVQGMNSLLGLAKTIGLDRRHAKTITLQEYVKKERRA